jgi:hypothetical protein
VSEEWRQALGCLPYDVSTEGRVRSRATGMVVETRVVETNRSKRRVFRLRTSSGSHTLRVNRLVCETFRGAPPSTEHVVLAEDGDSTNCRLENLRWATRSEVVRATVDRGRHVSGLVVAGLRRKR